MGETIYNLQLQFYNFDTQLIERLSQQQDFLSFVYFPILPVLCPTSLPGSPSGGRVGRVGENPGKEVVLYHPYWQ